MKRTDLEALAAALAPIIREHVARAVAAVSERIDGLSAPEKGEPGADGKDGRDGKDADPEAIFVKVRGWLENYFLECPPVRHGRDGSDGKDGRDGADGENGKDGRDGIDGKSVTLEDVQPILEVAIAKGLLDLERRAQDILQRAVDRFPKPQDGKDGRDGLALEDFELSLSDDERTLTVALVRGETRVCRSVRLSHPVHRGVWTAGQFQKGDCVTFGGSTWIATRDTSSKPETDDSWRLIVKRGRDGKGA